MHIFRDEHNHFDNAFRNWRRDLFGPSDFAPTNLYPHRRSDEGSSEEGNNHIRCKLADEANDKQKNSQYTMSFERRMAKAQKQTNFILIQYFIYSVFTVETIGGTLGGNGPHEFEIESHVGHETGGLPTDSSEEDSVVIQESPFKPFYNTPFFGDPFFNAFGFGFPGFGGPQNVPWWKG